MHCSHDAPLHWVFNCYLFMGILEAGESVSSWLGEKHYMECLVLLCVKVLLFTFFNPLHNPRGMSAMIMLVS